MREAVRSGRRINFFITENRFIDDYASRVGGNGVAVYCILQRCANSETRETWISAGKMADVLAIDKSTVYRKLKELEDLRLIRTLRTREKTIYVVLEVPPPRPEVGPTPLFDAIEPNNQGADPTWPPVAQGQVVPSDATNEYSCDSSVASVQQELASVQRTVASAQPPGGAGKKCNKEEQNEFNKTQEQNEFNNSWENDDTAVADAARRVLTGLQLTSASLNAAIAAVKAKPRSTGLSADDVVYAIRREANYAERRGVTRKEFLDDFLAQLSGQRILNVLGLPDTYSMSATVTAAVKADIAYTGMPVEQVASHIVSAAIEDRRMGVQVDRFYFENVKWRSRGVTKAEKRTLDNLEVNARVKQRIRERLGRTS